MSGSHERPSVSVLMPVYNARNTLRDAVNSIRAQSLADWELVVCDDGSDDGSDDAAETFARQDSRIRVIRAAHKGIVASLDSAYHAARGEFLARMDADDVAHPTRLEKQLQFMQNHPATALCGTGIVTTGSGIHIGRQRYEEWLNGVVAHEDIVRELFVECPIPHPTFMMRRDAYEAVGGYRDCGWAEDYDLCMRFFQAGYCFGKLPEALLEWRESPSRLSRNDPRYSPEAFRALKRHYLFETYLKDRTFYQWGAGEIGKEWLKEWTVHRRPVAVVDINLRKIGERIHGLRVIAPEQLPPPGETFTVIAVGTPGARDVIRARLNPQGYKELRDYLFLA